MDTFQIIKEKIKNAQNVTFKDPTSAFELADEARITAQANGFVNEEAEALFYMALSCRSMTRLSDCYDYAFDALQLYESCSNVHRTAVVLNLIGVVYFYNAMFERALETFLKAEHLLQQSPDLLVLTRVYNNMGEVYREVNNWDAALEAYNHAYELCNQESYHEIAVILGNIGEIHFLKMEYDISEEYFNRSLKILVEHTEITTAIAEIETRLGNIHFIRRQFKEAREHYNQSMSMYEVIGNHYFAIETLMSLAELEMIENEDNASLYIEKAINYAEGINARKKLSDIYLRLTAYFEAKREFELALAFYKKYHLVEQEISTSAMSGKLEIIKLELSKLLHGEDVEKIRRLNNQLETEISKKNTKLKELEKSNRSLKVAILQDELTRIPNRRGIKNHLSIVWNQPESPPLQTALFILDIDHFKRFNDFHGHLEGDHCLRQIALCLKLAFEQIGGIVGRYGGEEFIGFVKDIDEALVSTFTDSILESVMALGLSYKWKDMICPVTVSIGGIIGSRAKFGDYQAMLAIADEQLYLAKEAGRNKACLKKQI